MGTLNEKTSEFFFIGFREKFLLENAGATEGEIKQAFQRLKQSDDLFAVKFGIVKFFVALGVAFKYVAPGVILAVLAIYFGVDRIFF